MNGLPSINRITPNLPTAAMKTYSVRAPLGSHWRKATCAEVDCESYLHGWMTTVPSDSAQAHYIRKESGRRFIETTLDGGRVIFTFEPGQRCFGSDEHTVHLDREAFYVVREGDWRGNPRPHARTNIQHVRADDWVDDFATHQGRLADRLERG